MHRASGDASSVGNMVGCVISLRESIDPVAVADKNRLQNGRVAQELASWIDVSRRLPREEALPGIAVAATTDDDMEEWASVVRQRMLAECAGGRGARRGAQRGRRRGGGGVGDIRRRVFGRLGAHIQVLSGVGNVGRIQRDVAVLMR